MIKFKQPVLSIKVKPDLRHKDFNGLCDQITSHANFQGGKITWDKFLFANVLKCKFSDKANAVVNFIYDVCKNMNFDVMETWVNMPYGDLTEIKMTISPFSLVIKKAPNMPTNNDEISKIMESAPYKKGVENGKKFTHDFIKSERRII